MEKETNPDTPSKKETASSGEVTYKLMQSINGGTSAKVGDIIGLRGNQMLVNYGGDLVILNTAIATMKEKIDAQYNFTTFTALNITTSGKTLKQITDELYAKNLPTNTIVTGQLYSPALPFSGNGEAEVMINGPAFWWTCKSLTTAPYSWNAIAGGGSWSGIKMDWTPSFPAVDTSMSDSSVNAVQNKIIKKYVDDSVYGKADASSLAAVATSGQYSDLSGTPSLAEVATTGAYSDLSGTPSLANVATSGAYSDLSGTPSLASVATSGAYSDLSGTPTLSSVATSGQYSDLTGTPTIDSEMSDSSTNAVQNSTIKNYVDSITGDINSVLEGVL